MYPPSRNTGERSASVTWNPRRTSQYARVGPAIPAPTIRIRLSCAPTRAQSDPRSVVVWCLTSSLTHRDLPVAGGDHELVTAVLRPAGLFVLLAHRLLLPVAHDRQSGGVDAVLHEIAPRRGRPAHAEREIVFVGSTFVRVALD